MKIYCKDVATLIWVISEHNEKHVESRQKEETEAKAQKRILQKIQLEQARLKKQQEKVWHAQLFSELNGERKNKSRKQQRHYKQDLHEKKDKDKQLKPAQELSNHKKQNYWTDFELQWKSNGRHSPFYRARYTKQSPHHNCGRHRD